MQQNKILEALEALGILRQLEELKKSTGKKVELLGGATVQFLRHLADVTFSNLVDGEVLKYDASLKKWTNKPDASGTGDVVGPVSSVNENIAVFDGVTGKLIKDGGKKISEIDTDIAGKLDLDGSNANTTIDIQGENLVNVGNLGVGTASPTSSFSIYKPSTQPTADMGYGGLTMPNFSTIFPSLGTGIFKYETYVSGAYGGAAINGFTDSDTGATAFLFSGYQGSTTPTATNMLFRTAKHNGATSATGLAWAETAFQFRNWTSNLITVLGSGSTGFGTETPTAQLQVNTLSASRIAQIVRGATSQTANLTEWQNSSGTVLSHIDSSGKINSQLGNALGNFFAGGAGKVGKTSGASIGIGFGVLGAETTGTNNVALGTYSQKAVSSGNANVSIGSYSLYTLTTGSGNFALGNYALHLTTGSGNIAIGNISGQNTTTGDLNVFIGAGSGLANSTGKNNIFIGAYSGYRQTTNSNLFIVDSVLRADEATEVSNAILYGVMSSTPASQRLRINAKLTADASTVPVTVIGATSQTANLTEWQDSSGTVGSAFTSDTSKLLLGTGTNNTTSSRLFVTETSTAPTEISQIYAQRLMTNPLTNRGSTNISIQVAQTSASYSGQNIGTISQAWIRNTNTQNWTASGIVNQLGLVGLEARVEVRSGASGTLSWLTGLVTDADFNSNSTATVTNYAGFKIFEPVNASSLLGFTNNYGLYVANMSAATNNYAILTNAGNIVFNEGGDASTDFRVESDTEANMLFLDANADTDGALYLGGTTNGIKITKGGIMTFLGTSAIAGGATGTFTTSDAKTVTVTNGIITSII